MNKFGIALVAGILALSGGCASDAYNEDESIGKTSIDIEGASREALVGDTVTFVARSQDTYGRDAEIKWSSTGGDVVTEQDGRIARVKFNEPGTYSVRATLDVDGHAVKSDIVEVRVKPIK